MKGAVAVALLLLLLAGCNQAPPAVSLADQIRAECRTAVSLLAEVDGVDKDTKMQQCIRARAYQLFGEGLR